MTSAVLSFLATASHPLVQVEWVNSEYFAALPDADPLPHQIAFLADESIEPGTVVGIELSAGVGLGDTSNCDCPGVEADRWSACLVIDV